VKRGDTAAAVVSGGVGGGCDCGCGCGCGDGDVAVAVKKRANNRAGCSRSD